MNMKYEIFFILFERQINVLYYFKDNTYSIKLYDMLQKIELFYTVYTCTFQLPNKSNKYKIIASSAHVIVHTTTHPFILHINMYTT